MTMRLVYSSLITILTVIIPTAVAIQMFAELNVCLEDKLLLYNVAEINPLINVYIYLIKHRSMRTGFAALLQRKTMPPDLKLWNVSTTTGAQKQQKKSAK